MEEKIPREKPNLKRNVHFWLRKVFYFVWKANIKEVPVEESYADKGTPELRFRQGLNELGYKPEVITKDEALEACQKLNEMFREAFEPDVQKFIEDPLCPGGKPRGYGH